MLGRTPPSRGSTHSPPMKRRSKRKLSGMPPSTISYKRLICPYMETRVKMRKRVMAREAGGKRGRRQTCGDGAACAPRSEEHTSELQYLMRVSYVVCCLKNKHRDRGHSNIYTDQSKQQNAPASTT